MSIRRYYVPNAIVFLTQVVDRRHPIFRQQHHLDLLRAVLHRVQTIQPFHMLGFVFLPDHFHLLIRPTVSDSFSKIMHLLKRNFTLEYKRTIGIHGPMQFWQKSFWDHIIRDEEDLWHHLCYIHYNPVHHGWVDKPEDWPHSSYLAWKGRGVYSDGWGWSLPDTIAQIEQKQAECDSR